MLLLASDLDNTLIYSYQRLSEGAVCVESKDGKPLSFMMPAAYERLQTLAERLLFVPVTTRSLEQYQRIELLQHGRPPRLALTSNGGLLLVEGQVDPAWRTQTQQLVRPALPALRQAQALLAAQKDVYLPPRLVDEIFLFAKTRQVAHMVERLRAALDKKTVFVDSHGEKIYVFPRALHKGLAIARLRERVGDCTVMAAGDSLFDAPMLWQADAAVIPNEEPLLAAMQGKKELLIHQKERLDFAQTVLEAAWQRL